MRSLLPELELSKPCRVHPQHLCLGLSDQHGLCLLLSSGMLGFVLFELNRSTWEQGRNKRTNEGRKKCRGLGKEGPGTVEKDSLDSFYLIWAAAGVRQGSDSACGPALSPFLPQQWQHLCFNATVRFGFPSLNWNFSLFVSRHIYTRCLVPLGLILLHISAVGKNCAKLQMHSRLVQCASSITQKAFICTNAQ